MNYNYTEEAFLLSSLQEVVKVWGKGKGSSSFNLKVCDGVAELVLSFTLGYPSDLHSSPPPQPDCHPQHDYPQHPQLPPQKVRHHRRRRKGPAQRERDRLRAEEHHSRQNCRTAASAVILPFSGKILPFNDPKHGHVDEVRVPAAAPVAASHTVAAPVAASQTAAAPDPPSQTAAAKVAPASPQPGPGTANLAAVRPTKPLLSSAVNKYVDVNLAKKQLFPPCQVPLASSQQAARKCYQMKEEDLWTKLFT